MKCLAIASLIVVLAASAASAADVAVSTATLEGMGLGSMQQLSDADGLAVRGKGFTGFTGFSLTPLGSENPLSFLSGLFGGSGSGNNGGNSGGNNGGNSGGGSGLGSMAFPGGGPTHVPTHSNPTGGSGNPFGYSLSAFPSLQ